MYYHKLNKEISTKKTNIVYAFIDSQNLNLGISKDIYKNSKRIYAGWQLNYKRFYRYLTDKFRVQKTFLFIGYKYLKANGKLCNILIPNRKSESSLLKNFQKYKIFLDREKEKLKLEYK